MSGADATRTRALRIAVNALNLPDRPAGISQYVRSLYSRLADLPGVEQVVIHAPRAASRYLAGLHPKVRIQAWPVQGALAGTLCSQLLLPFRLRGFDVLHSVGNVACLASPLPQLVTVHDLCQWTIPDRFGSSKRIYLRRGLAASVRRRGNMFLCVSANTLKDLERYHPAARGRSVVVHSAARFAASPPATRGERLLCIGTLEPGKNLSLAFRALALLRDRGRVLCMDVVGAPGWKHAGLPGELKRLGIAGQVRFTNFVDDATLQRMYREAALLVFPSRYEGFGFPILEAQSQGCPVVVADNSCMREVGGSGARYFRDNDAEDLAATLASLLDAPEDADALARMGYENVARFSWERAARETLAALRATVSGSGG